MPLRKIGELRIFSRLNSLAEVDNFTMKLIHALPLPTDARDDVAISISEAVNNAILHGNQQNPRKKVEIRFYLCSRYLRIVIQDHGAGFKPDHVPDPRRAENLLKASGRGVLIMRHLMDGVAFKAVQKGMQVVLIKNFTGREKIESS
jgi:serine/threonine-protein kinase RsbW